MARTDFAQPQRIVQRQRMRDAGLIELRRHDPDVVGQCARDLLDDLQAGGMDAVVIGAENSHPSKCLLVRSKRSCLWRRLIRLSRPRQTRRFPHVFFIQTRQGRANLAPPSILICRSGDPALAARRLGRALKRLRSAGSGRHGSRPFASAFHLRRVRLPRRRRRDRLQHWNLRSYRHRRHRAARLRKVASRNRQRLVEILGIDHALARRLSMRSSSHSLISMSNTPFSR